MATATMPYWSNSMNNMLGFHIASSGNHGFAGGQASLTGDNLLAFCHYGRPSSPVYGAIHSAATHQAGVGGINNGIGRLLGNVSLYYGELSLIPGVDKAEMKQEVKTYLVDQYGFLMKASEWDEDYAIRKAEEMKMPGMLSDKHWQIIHFLREQYKRTGVVPTVYDCCESNNIELEDMEKLFPDGYQRGAVKLSGLRVR